MVVQFDILRKNRESENQYIQNIKMDIEDENSSVANVLMKINSSHSILDMNGEKVEKIKWECSCLQKKCGACAMLINGRPKLACDARLKDYKTKSIRIEPLKKFPVIEDLMVDRSSMYENLKEIQVWLEENAKIDDKKHDMAYEGSRCLQCGCCLEVCPNFYTGGNFYGMSSMVPNSRILALNQGEEEQLKNYKKHIYEGCGKSLACRNICPVGIDIEDLLVKSNAIAVWKRRMRK